MRFPVPALLLWLLVLLLLLVAVPSALAQSSPVIRRTTDPSICATGLLYHNWVAGRLFSGNAGTCTQIAASGVVTAAAVFGNDNRLIRSDGTGRAIQASGITVDDSNNITGANSIATGGTGAGYFEGLEGTAPALVANRGQLVFPVDVAAGGVQHILPGTGATGIPHLSNSAGTVTWTVSAIDLASADVTGRLGYANVVQATAASRLLGRGSAGGAGNWEEITLGAGLTMTGTVLSASGSSLPAVDTTSIVEGSADNTKEIRFEVDGLTTGTIRVITPPDANTTLPVFSQVITFAGPTAARTITLPDEAFTVVGLATTQTLTNKTLTAPRIADLGFIADANGNEILELDTVTSAVNHIRLANAATGSGPTMSAVGDDTNVNITLSPKGTGSVRVLGTGTSEVGIGDTDNSHFLLLRVGSNLTADRILTLTTGDAARTVTLSGDLNIAGNLTTSGGQALTLTTTGTTNVTLPTTGTLAATAGPTFTGTVNISEAIQLAGDISPAQLTANQNDWNPTGLSTASTIRLSTDASRNITGLSGGADGRLVWVHNIGSNNVVLTDEDAGSAAANRFALNANITLGADQAALLQYDSTSSRWRVVATSVVSAGGGGLGDPGGNGVVVRTALNTTTNRTITGTTNQIVVTNGDGVSGNPTIDIGANVLTNSSTHTLTNKTYDAEATGNVLTVTAKHWFLGAGCNSSTAATLWDLPTSSAATPACVTGTNTQKGVLDFPDTAGGFSAQNSLLLPSDFTGNIDAKIIWFTTATTGNVKWSLSTICTATDATETDDPAFNTASTVTTAAPGTANRLQTSSISTVTITGCAAGELMHLKIFRDGNDAADTIAATARLYGIEITARRAQ